jgi:hypothetical protein
MTQPTLMHEGITPREDALLFTGGLDFVWSDPKAVGLACYTVSAHLRMLEQLNAALLSVCAEVAATCIDAARALTPSIDNFYDDWHFNEAGSRRLADVVFKGIIQR